MLRLANSRLAATAFVMAAFALVLSGALVPLGWSAAHAAHIHVSAGPMPVDENHDHMSSAAPSLLAIASGQVDAGIMVDVLDPSWTGRTSAAKMPLPREFGALQSAPQVDPPPPRAQIRFS